MKLIDKDAILAEIENLLDKGKYHEEYDCAYRDGNNGALYALKDKLDTLEVKEVDLDFLIHEEYAAAAKTECDCIECATFTKIDFTQLAKRFFELGMQVSNKAQKL